MLKHLSIFCLPLILTSGFLFLAEKGTVLLWINERHTILGDIVFPVYTELGNALTVTLVTVALLFWRYHFTLLMGLTAVLHGLLTTFLKEQVFAKVLRPKAFYEGTDVALNFVEGVETLIYHSFPSGHTATAFAMTFMLALCLRKPAISFVLMIVATLVGFSRIYILQHFFMDTFAGAIVGIFSSWLIWYLFHQRAPKLRNNPTWQASLLRPK